MRKAAHLLVAAAAGLAFSPAAFAQSVTVLGAGNAGLCADAAYSRDTSVAAIQACDSALLHEALRRDDRAATHVNRGILYAARGEFSSAIADYDRGVSLIPDLGAAYVNRGNVLFKLKRYEDAIADYDKALALGQAPRHIAHLNRGAANTQLERFADARADYEAALALRPAWEEVKRRLEQLDALEAAGG